jgi:hypothetical protein
MTPDGAEEGSPDRIRASAPYLPARAQVAGRRSPALILRVPRAGIDEQGSRRSAPYVLPPILAGRQ